MPLQQRVSLLARVVVLLGLLIQALTRGVREVRLTSTLTHPSTISIYDYGRSPDGVFYCARRRSRSAPTTCTPRRSIDVGRREV